MRKKCRSDSDTPLEVQVLSVTPHCRRIKMKLSHRHSRPFLARHFLPGALGWERAPSAGAATPARPRSRPHQQTPPPSLGGSPHHVISAPLHLGVAPREGEPRDPRPQVRASGSVGSGFPERWETAWSGWEPNWECLSGAARCEGDGQLT